MSTWHLPVAACDLAIALHECRCKAEGRDVTPWRGLPPHTKALLVEIAGDILRDLMETSNLAEVANDYVSQTRRVPAPLLWPKRS